jgi:hypothetical protein
LAQAGANKMDASAVYRASTAVSLMGFHQTDLFLKLLN